MTVTPTAARIAAVAAAAAAGGDQQQHPSVTVSLTAASQQQQQKEQSAVMREVVSQQPLNLKQVSPPSVTVIPSVPTSLRQPLQPQAPVQQQQPHGASLPQVPVSVATSVAAPVALSLVMNKSVEIKTVNPALEPQSLAGLDHGPPDAKKPRMAEENGCT